LTPSSPPKLPYSLDDAELWTRATDVEYLSTPEEFDILHSTAHDILFIDPVPKDRLHEIYPTNYYSFLDPSKSLVQRLKSVLDRRLFRAILSQIPGSSLNVLDVGGGAGWMLSQARAADSRVQRTRVVDIDPTPAAAAEKAGHSYFCGRIEDFKTDERFDLVLLLNLIEHVEAPLEVLEALRDRLSVQGRVLIKTPNWDSLDERVFRKSSWAGYHCPRHWVLFTKDSFSELAKLAGLRVVEFKYTQGAPFWAASTLVALGKRGLVRIDRERPVVHHPLFGLLNGVFAAFDFLRMPFAKTSQMFFVLARSD
jgi:2-polyprenyl-3-methyl-5-hydroxy-6-metoxy-1,4-benzoquinol methylase